MESSVSALELRRKDKELKIDVAEIDELAADLAAAITSNCQLNQNITKQELIISEEVIEPDSAESFRYDILALFISFVVFLNLLCIPYRPIDSLVLEPEPLNSSFSALSKMNPSNESLSCLPPNISTLKTELHRLLSDCSTCSFKVYVGKYKFRCHLNVLQSHTKYFLNFEDCCTAHLPIEHVTPSGFHVIYNWMLDKKTSSERPKGGCSMVELYSTAKFLEVEDILEFCWASANDDQVVGFIAFAHFLAAEKLEIPIFKTLMLSRIGELFLPLVASKEFLDLEVKWLCELLKMHNLGVNSEIEIFMSAVRWLSHDWSNRKKFMEKIMACVRFYRLPPPFLRYLQGEQPTRVFKSISQSPKIKENINRVFVYTCAEICNMTECTYNLKDLELSENRNWIFDSRCPYHRQPGGNQEQFFTYQQFLNYLELLHDTPADHVS
ncbi:hypothetical protein KR009_003925 [Drosophila setifemur]|nr:hypothetical protein KR009_003925 [Drosophila setifemur]